MRLGFFLFLATLAGGLTAPGMALAQPGGVQPLDRLLPEIRRNNPGRFYDAEPRRTPDGREEYRLKWMTPDGRILYLDADARTGRVTRRAPDRDREAYDRDNDGPGFEERAPRRARGDFRTPDPFDPPRYEGSGSRLRERNRDEGYERPDGYERRRQMWEGFDGRSFGRGQGANRDGGRGEDNQGRRGWNRRGGD